MDRPQREQAILSQLLQGNLPGYLRKLVPIKLSFEPGGGNRLAATIFVMPEYLAIGSDSDFLRIPMNLHTAMAVADQFSCLLPTKKIVDAIYDQSTCHFTPQPLPAGPQMTSTEYYRIHNAMIDKQSQSRGFPLGPLVSGHKKDVVLTNRLATHPGQIAIYGWHRATGAPIQPLSTVHGAGYGHGRRPAAIRPRHSAGSLVGEGAQRRGNNPRCSCLAALRLLQALTAAKAQMIVRMTVLVHHTAPMPIRRTPPAPVLMSSVSIEDKPATLHLGVA